MRDPACQMVFGEDGEGGALGSGVGYVGGCGCEVGGWVEGLLAVLFLSVLAGKDWIGRKGTGRLALGFIWIRATLKVGAMVRRITLSVAY